MNSKPHVALHSWSKDLEAHARIHADRLAAIDRGYLRQWFPDLKLLSGGEGR